MKNKIYYGIFTKGRGGKFVGPRFGELLTIEEIYDFDYPFKNPNRTIENFRKQISKETKRKTVIKKQVWKNV